MKSPGTFGEQNPGIWDPTKEEAGGHPLPRGGQLLKWIARAIVGGVFVFAGALKIADPAKFAMAVANYRVLPHEVINLAAIFLPWIEVTAGFFVLSGIWLKEGAIILASVTLIFLVVVLSALARGLNIECGCFGTVGGAHVGLITLAIDSTLFCLAVFLTKD